MLVGQGIDLLSFMSGAPALAMQIDVDDALRGHVFAVQDAIFWISFIIATTAAAAFIPADGHSVALALAGSALYVVGLAAHLRLDRTKPAAT